MEQFDGKLQIGNGLVVFNRHAQPALWAKAAQTPKTVDVRRPTCDFSNMTKEA
jgi:hypothetical protein